MAKKSKNERSERRRATGAPQGTRADRANSDGTAELASRPEVIDDTRAADSPGDFPIVGIGASAGGLEALELFIKNVPQNCGMAFVVVQHLGATHRGAMVTLLQRITSMKVVEVTEGATITPNSIYLIPPNKDLSIQNGVLHIFAPVLLRGLRLPIDSFFRSLAEDRQEHSIGVVLSGMGTDGTLGLRAIKEKAGGTFAQSLSSAKFDGMPRSAIEAGLVDVVASAEELPAKIEVFVRHTRLERPAPEHADKTDTALERIFVLLRAQTGNDFSSYKKSTLYRRIERRMGLRQISKISNYVEVLRGDRDELERLFKELLIGVTNFFRDSAVWQFLADNVLPDFLSERGQERVLRAWVAACSTGEEAYSLAMVLKEAIERVPQCKTLKLQIFATDLDREAIEKARLGQYPENIAADISAERLERFFVRNDHGYRVSKEIREMVIFAPQNLIMDPPFTKLDILCCRNLLIYLSPEVQRRLIPLFHYSLKPGGILFLGTSETVGSVHSLFTGVGDGRPRIYRRVVAPPKTVQVDFPTLFDPQNVDAPETQLRGTARNSVLNPQALAEQALLRRFSPAAVLADERGDILYFHGRTGRFLEPASGRASFNLLSMARDGLHQALTMAFRTALREGHAASHNVPVRVNGGSHLVDLTIERLTGGSGLQGPILVVFSETPSIEDGVPPIRKGGRGAKDPKLQKLEVQLEHALEEAQGVREEMQTSQEELKSTNEELQSTNEELQSTNEELTTSKEEMQSLNEELQTVNHELQAKVDELSRSNNDMKNLLNSTDIATLFLDSDLNVRRFTTETTKLIKLMPTDSGRPITDLTTELDYPDLAGDAREVLRTLVFKEKLVAARNGQWYSVRILPYRTLENVIDGVVVTFTDVTAAKASQQALHEQLRALHQAIDTLPLLIARAQPDGKWNLVNHQWQEYTGVPSSQQLGSGWLDQVHADDRARALRSWHSGIASGDQFGFEVRLQTSTGDSRLFRFYWSPARDAPGVINGWLGYATELKLDIAPIQRLESGGEGTDEKG